MRYYELALHRTFLSFATRSTIYGCCTTHLPTLLYVPQRSEATLETLSIQICHPPNILFFWNHNSSTTTASHLTISSQNANFIYITYATVSHSFQPLSIDGYTIFCEAYSSVNNRRWNQHYVETSRNCLLNCSRVK